MLIDTSKHRLRTMNAWVQDFEGEVCCCGLNLDWLEPTPCLKLNRFQLQVNSLKVAEKEQTVAAARSRESQRKVSVRISGWNVKGLIVPAKLETRLDPSSANDTLAHPSTILCRHDGFGCKRIYDGLATCPAGECA